MNETFKEKLKKLLSTKFIGMASTIATGVLLITQDKYVEGAALIAVALITYCVANSYITIKTAATVASAASTVANTVSITTTNTVDDIVAEVLAKISTALNAEVSETSDSSQTESSK